MFKGEERFDFSDNTISEHFVESSFELRTKRQHSVDLDKLSKDTSLVHSRGIKSDSILNRSLFYHVVNNKSLDMMHVVLKGCLP
jgi:hypothetical protein